MGQLSLAQGRHTDREHRGRFPEWLEAHALARGHLRRDPAKTWYAQFKTVVTRLTKNYEIEKAYYSNASQFTRRFFKTNWFS
jgi:hypothetical protein